MQLMLQNCPHLNEASFGVELIDPSSCGQFDGRQISMPKTAEEMQSRICSDVVADADGHSVLVASAQDLLGGLAMHHSIQMT